MLPVTSWFTRRVGTTCPPVLSTTANLPRQKPTAGCPPWRRDRRHLGISAQHTVERFAVVLGSVDFIGAARTGIFVEQHPTDPGKVLLAQSKSNIGIIGRTQV